jgi:hypothetical protein
MKFSQAALFVVATAASAAAFVPASVAKQRASFGLSQNGFASSSPSRLLMSATVEKAKETFEFTSDVGRVMDLIINSLYSDKVRFTDTLVVVSWSGQVARA